MSNNQSNILNTKLSIDSALKKQTAAEINQIRQSLVDKYGQRLEKVISGIILSLINSG